MGTDSMQGALEQESRGKAEALRMKKKLEADVAELDVSLEHSNAANIETQKTIKQYHSKIRDAQAKLEDEQRAKEVTRDHLLACERKANSAQNALEEARTLLEQSDRARRVTEQELALNFERDRKLLECQVKDMGARLDEAETNALKGGKKAMLKMETRIRELESEVDAENRRMADAQKNLRKSERRIKEMTYGSDEDRKNHERMQGLIDQLQSKIKSYKKQIEEAEEIAAMNLAKFRQAQANLGDAEERADLNEQALAKLKAKGRAGSIGL